MVIQNAWLPEVPYTYNRMVLQENGDEVTFDSLIVHPVQFNAQNERTGIERKFSQIVLEVSYLNPSAPGAVNDREPPRINSASITQQNAQGGLSDYLIRVRVTDNLTSNPEVTAIYTIDGVTWKQLRLQATSGNFYQAMVKGPTIGRDIAVMFEARDQAGNTSTHTSKGALNTYHQISLPVLFR